MKKIGLFLFIFCLGNFASFAQPVRGISLDKKIEFADELLAKGDIYNALEWYDKVLEEDKKNVHAISRIAETHYKLRDFKAAEKAYARLMKKDKDGVKYPLARFTYARVLKMNEKYDEAIAELTTFSSQEGIDTKHKTLAITEIAGAELAKEMEDNPKVTYANAGSGVNSPSSEASPAGVGDSELYYTSLPAQEVPTQENVKEKVEYMKAYKSSKSGDSWGAGKVLDKINKDGTHTGNLTVSADGNVLYFTRCGLKGNLLDNCHIFMSQKDGESWSEPVQLEGINGDSYTSKQPALGTVNGKEAMFFASNMSGGQGGWDIYYAMKEGNSQFGAPLNAGSIINTIGDEETPFSADGKIYFSSTGHPGIGGYDVFSADEASGTWRNVENMGKGVNSRVDDLYFRLNSGGCTGFVVSNRPGTTSLKSETCCDDIFALNIEQTYPASLDLYVFDSEGAKSALKGSKVVVTDSEGKKQELTNKTGNDYNFKLEEGNSYSVAVSRAGFQNGSANAATTTVECLRSGDKNPNELSENVYLKAIPIVNVEKKPEYRYIDVVLEPIYWNFDSYKVRPEAAAKLDALAAKILANPSWGQVSLSSHTDALGINAYNDRLSQRRTEAAKIYLVKRGVDATRLEGMSYGERQPAAENKIGRKDNPTGRQLNRRTQFQAENARIKVKIN